MGSSAARDQQHGLVAIPSRSRQLWRWGAVVCEERTTPRLGSGCKERTSGFPVGLKRLLLWASDVGDGDGKDSSNWALRRRAGVVMQSGSASMVKVETAMGTGIVDGGDEVDLDRNCNGFFGYLR
ncbi:hypothetical protein M0R45_006705 [Rubus argutus]|uniref:Uncharacterized protein n=1 Tax=Rubus argutus TaxID=59490 RepID=A0AAW1YRS1_RUBAR